MRDVTSTGWELQPWPHNVLVTADEHGRGALARVYKKAVATAEAGRRVVMVMQEAPREGPVGGEVEAGPRPKKRHQKRLQRPSHDARLANKRANQGEPEPREGGRWNPETRG